MTNNSPTLVILCIVHGLVASLSIPLALDAFSFCGQILHGLNSPVGWVLILTLPASLVIFVLGLVALGFPTFAVTLLAFLSRKLRNQQSDAFDSIKFVFLVAAYAVVACLFLNQFWPSVSVKQGIDVQNAYQNSPPAVSYLLSAISGITSAKVLMTGTISWYIRRQR